MGRLDRTLRFFVGAVLIPTGLFALGGGQGNLIGIVVAAVAAMPILTGLAGFCPAYLPFGISTLGRDRNPAKALTG